MTGIYTLSETYGLVVCGGKSSRMGIDKSILKYYEKQQRYHMYNRLMPLCKRVFISCNEEQEGNIEKGYQFIKDGEGFGDVGPIKALLTAFTKYPEKNLLFIGCDYPFLTLKELQLFSFVCKKEPAAFYNNSDNMYEPMLAWYPYTCFDELKRMHKAKEFSLQHFLKINHAVKHLPANNNCIQSIDTPEGFKAAYKLLNGG